MKKVVFLALISLGFLLSGCAEKNVVEKKVYEYKYVPSEDIKKAVAILIYKNSLQEKEIEQLKNRIAKCETTHTVYTSKITPKKVTVNNSQKCQITKSNVTNLIERVLHKKECLNNKDVDKYLWEAKKDVNVRCCPTLTAPVLKVIKKGTKVRFTECNKYCWCRVKGEKGWVAKFLFKKVSR